MTEGALLSAELKLAGRLDARFFALLQAIDATGSINLAARTAGYSYRGAWLVLEGAGNLASDALTERSIGGKGGGGSRLTPTAHALMAAWATLQAAHHHFLRTQEAWLAQQPVLAGALLTLKRMAMKTTARNQFAGTISRLEKGAVSSMVGVTLPGGTVVTASVTNDAVTALGLAVGQEATAVFKADSVMLAVARPVAKAIAKT